MQCEWNKKNIFMYILNLVYAIYIIHVICKRYLRNKISRVFIINQIYKDMYIYT
jgi:hypothetical protein